MRISSFERASICPASTITVEGEPVSDSGDPSARLGTAAHAALAAYVVHGIRVNLMSLAEEMRVDDLDDLRRLVAYGVTAWDQTFRQFFPQPACELVVRSEYLSRALGEDVVGHIDVAYANETDGYGVVLDWKSGWGELDYWQNMRAYALALAETYKLHRVSATVVHLRFGTAQTKVFETAELTRWVDSEVVPRLRGQQDHYSAGAQCMYCPRSTSCPERRQIVASTIGALVSHDQQPLRGLFPELYDPDRRAQSAELVRSVVDRLTLVESLCRAAREELRRNAQQHGPLPLPDGKLYGMVPKNVRELDALAAMPILLEHATPQEINEHVKVSIGAVEDLVARRMAKRYGTTIKAAREQLRDRLAGCVTTTQRLELRAAAAERFDVPGDDD